MANDLEEDQALLPVTALAFVQLGDLYLLAGEGKYLKIYHYVSKRLLCTQQVFESQAIHDITCGGLAEYEGDTGLLLISGGRSVCVLGLSKDRSPNHRIRIKVPSYVQETQLDDWILDGCFQTSPLDRFDCADRSCNALLVTAHNELHSLSFNTSTSAHHEIDAQFSHIASGPRSILYSAHLVWTEDDHVLVAAGTVFGEVLLWSYHVRARSADRMGTLCHRFLGHEGSVFGVRISEPSLKAEDMGVKRVLASCSDDRTIRIWDISELDPLTEETNGLRSDDEITRTGTVGDVEIVTTSNCLAMIMGHASRIWGLRFLGHVDGIWQIISHGEDGTAQVWRLCANSSTEKTNVGKPGLGLALKHQETYSYHSGKNVWAIAHHSERSNGAVIATGGADGRIATYNIISDKSSVLDIASSTRQTMSEIEGMAVPNEDSPPPVPRNGAHTMTKKVFDSLQGQWKLSRRIESMNSNYPSGSLDGTATFESRLSSDKTFAAEYLYSENGEFITGSGISMKATRQYVYRYNIDKDKITVWFVRPEDGSIVDYFFHDLDFRDLARLAQDSALIEATASGHHLCDQDDYRVEYRFSSSNVDSLRFTVSFTVVGPKKNYITTATYTRENQLDVSEIAQPTAGSTEADIVQTPKVTRLPKTKVDSFKTYAWISEDKFMTSTEQGNLLIGTLNTRRKSDNGNSITWSCGGNRDSLRSSCIASSISALGICFLTGMDGTVLLYNHSNRSVEVIHSIFRKAGFLKAQKLPESWGHDSPKVFNRTGIGVLAVGLGSSIAAALFLHPGEEASMYCMGEQCSLKLPTNFIVTSASFVHEGRTIVLGSRSGDLAIYKVPKNPVNSARQTMALYRPNIHGQDAVTSIGMASADTHSPYASCIITTGRNGNFGIHRIIHKDVNSADIPVDIETLHTCVPPFGPNIEGVCIDAENLYLWGFRSKDFVVWNETDKTEVMTVSCGGSHRNWAYRHRCDGKGGGDFVYTKASVCYVHSQTQAFHQVLQHGAHGREMKAIALSPLTDNGDGSEARYLATGAEDTAIRIFDANSSAGDLRCLHFITKHTTGLQKLYWSPDRRLLFSAAGCEEFFVWRIRPAPLVTIGVVCEAQCPRVTEDGDLRVMDFTAIPLEVANHHSAESDYLISMVYSDFSVRVFRYHTHTKSFALLLSGIYSTYCLTQTTYLHSANKLWLCTASTDGHLAFWPLPIATDKSNPSKIDPRVTDASPASSEPTPISFKKRIPLHQNSIKSMTTILLSQYNYLITTGGDDGAIAFTQIQYTPEDSPTHSTLVIPKAHASAVTAVAHLGRANTADSDAVTHRFASVGNDQRIKTWVITVDLAKQGAEGIQVTKGNNVSTGVADASSLDLGVDGKGERRLYVAGIGMECWKVRDGMGGLTRVSQGCIGD